MPEPMDNANVKTPAELVAEIEHRLEAEGDDGFVRDSSASVIRADRRGH